MNFFKLYIGDYQRDTAHLSITEHGAYMLMLQHYYATEKPLPIGKALHRMLRAQDKAEREAIDSIAAQFWTTTDAGLVNARADDEITKASEQAATNRRIAEEREAKRKVARSVHEPSTNRATNDQPNQTPDTRQEQRAIHSEANASAADAPPTPPPMTPKERLWAIGVSLLGEKGRAHVGKLVATYGEAVVLDAMQAANAEQPGDPKAWIVAACEARKKPKANGKHAETNSGLDLLDRQPWQPWLQGTGFATIFEAESAGCGPGNAHKFRDGSRAAA